MKPQLIVLFFNDAMILCVAGGLGQMSEWSVSCLVIFIDGKLRQRKLFPGPIENKAGTAISGPSICLSFTGSYFVTTMDESIHCLAAPSLQRLFQVLEGRYVKTQAFGAITPDTSQSGPRDSAGKYL